MCCAVSQSGPGSWCTAHLLLCRQAPASTDRRVQDLENEVAALQLELQARPSVRQHRTLQRKLHALGRNRGA